MALQHPVNRRWRGYPVTAFPQGRMDLVAVHPALALGDELDLDAFRLAPFPPFGAPPAGQQIGFVPAAQIAIVIFAEGLRARPMVRVEVPDTLEHRRPAGLHRFVFRNQKSPLLQIVAFNRTEYEAVKDRKST